MKATDRNLSALKTNVNEQQDKVYESLGVNDIKVIRNEIVEVLRKHELTYTKSKVILKETLSYLDRVKGKQKV